jgi:SAM-dependent methyltransferase
MTDYITRTLSAYDADPKKYEIATADMSPTEEVEAFIAQLPTKDLPLLDAGCAFGRDTALFAERGYTVVGIDMSEGLLKRARELSPELTFKKMDVRKLDLKADSIAGIWCHATLLHLKDDDVTQALHEFERVLTTNGVAFLSFKEGTGEEEFVEKFSSTSTRYFNYQTEGSVRTIVEESGLEVARLYTINERQRWGADKRDLNWVYCFAKKAKK